MSLFAVITSVLLLSIVSHAAGASVTLHLLDHTGKEPTGKKFWIDWSENWRAIEKTTEIEGKNAQIIIDQLKISLEATLSDNLCGHDPIYGIVATDKNGKTIKTSLCFKCNTWVQAKSGKGSRLVINGKSGIENPLCLVLRKHIELPKSLLVSKSKRVGSDQTSTVSESEPDKNQAKTITAKQAAKVTATLNGKRVNIKVESLSSVGIDDPRLLMEVDDFKLLMVPRPSYEFATDPEDKSRLYEVLNGDKQLVAVRHKPHHPEPFSKLKKSDLKHVCGIGIGASVENVANILKDIDPAKVFLSISHSWETGIAEAAAVIPANIQYLEISLVGDLKKDVSYLAHLTSLKYLSMDTMAAFEKNLELADNSDLTFLRVSMSEIDKLPRLANLKTLVLKDCYELEDVNFLKEFRDLEQLTLESPAEIKDFSPIQSLKKLRSVNANGCYNLAVLPSEPMPNLKVLNILDSKPPMEAFIKANPQCHVESDSEELLKKAMAGADELRIYPRFMMVAGGGRSITEEELIAWRAEFSGVIGKDAVKEIIDNIKIAPGGFSRGLPTNGLAFFRNGELVANLYYSEHKITWSGWTHNYTPTKESSDYLEKMMTKHSEWIRRSNKHESDSKSAKEKFLSFYPPAGRTALIKKAGGFINEIPQTLRDAVNDPAVLLDAVCISLGSSDPRIGWFRAEDFHCCYVIDAVATTSPELFIKTLEKFKAENNEAGLLGASVLFFESRMRYSKTFRTKLPVAAQDKWGEILAKLVLSKPRHCIGYHSVVDSLQQIGAPWTTEMLRGIARGKLGVMNARDYNYSGFSSEVSYSLKLMASIEEITVAAYLALAEKGDSSVENEIAELLAKKKAALKTAPKTEEKKGNRNVALLELAMLNLGNHSYFNTEMFAYSSNKVIPYSALRAVEKFNGRHCLEILMNECFEKPMNWMFSDKIEPTITRIIGVDLFSEIKASNEPLESPEKRKAGRLRRERIKELCEEKAKKWWEEHGEAFVAQRRKAK